MRAALSLLLFLASFAGAAGAARAGEPPPEKKLVVTDLKPAGADLALVKNISDALLEALKSRPGYRVMGRSEIALILSHEKQKSLVGCADESCMADLGVAMNADLLCGGTLGLVGNAWLLSVYLTDVKTAKVVARASQTALAPEELLAAAKQVADGLLAPGEKKKGKEKETGGFTLGKGKVTLAALDLTASGVDKQVAENLTQVVVHELKNLPNASVISRDEIGAILMHEKDKAMLGCDDTNCLAELGGALGAQYLVAGTVGRVGDMHLLHLKLISIREARTANRVAEAFSGDEAQLIAATRFATRSLVGLSREGHGTLDVKPSVSDARLTIDGAPVETGAQALKAGKYALRLEAKGYSPWFTDAYVDAGEVTRLNATLTALPQPIYKKWWLWTVVAVVVAGGATAVALGVQSAGTRPETTYDLGLQVHLPQK